MMLDHAHAVILNPHSNGKRGFVRWKKFLESDFAKKAELSKAPIFDGRGCGNRFQLERELRRWVYEKIDSGCRNFVAAGGDGTVNLALNILMSLKEENSEVQSCRLGAIGLGSSNDFHKPFQVSNYHPESRTYCRLNFSLASPHDVGRVESTDVKFFVINASIGITAQANHFFNQAGPWFQSLKRRSVNTAVLLAALREYFTFQSFPVKITARNQSVKALEIVNLGIVKNPHFAGSFRYDRGPAADDGQFGVYICQNMSKIRILRILMGLSKGRFSGFPGTSFYQTSELTLDSCSPFALETDGEVFLTRRASLRNLQKQLYICPK